MSTEMPDEFLERLEAHRTEAAVVPAAALRRVYHVSVHGAEVLQEMRLLLEHGHAQAARERLLASVDAQVGLQVPGHAELFAAVLAAVLAQVRHVAARRAAAVAGGPGAGASATHAVVAAQTVDEAVVEARRSVLALQEVRVGRQGAKNRATAGQRQAMGPRVDKRRGIGQGRRSSAATAAAASTVRTRRSPSVVMRQVVVVGTQVVVVVMWVVVVVQEEVGGLPRGRQRAWKEE